jgi:hypothetical protein
VRRKAHPDAHDAFRKLIEYVRLSLLGVVATCELVRSSFAASRCTGIVLTRGALQPLRETLTLLGEDDPEFSTVEYRRAYVTDLSRL